MHRNAACAVLLLFANHSAASGYVKCELAMHDTEWPLFGEDRCIHAELELRDLTQPIEGEVHRLLYLPTWTAPYVITVECQGDFQTVTARQSDGVGGYFSGEVVKSGTRELLPREWKKLRRLVHSEWFSKMPTSLEDDEWLDGYSYHLESRCGDSYHQVVRCCPDAVRFARFRKFNRLTRYFEALAPIDISLASFTWMWLKEDRQNARSHWRRTLGVETEAS